MIALFLATGTSAGVQHVAQTAGDEGVSVVLSVLGGLATLMVALTVLPWVVRWIRMWL